MKNIRKLLLSCVVAGACVALFSSGGKKLKAAEIDCATGTDVVTDVVTGTATDEDTTDSDIEVFSDIDFGNMENIPTGDDESDEDDIAIIEGSVKNIMDDPSIDWSEYKGADIIINIKDKGIVLITDGSDDGDDDDASDDDADDDFEADPDNTFYDGMDYGDVYDYKYYIEHNPDIKEAFWYDPEGAFLQFLLYGIKEGRQAKESFGVQDFKNANLDLRYKFGAEGLEAYLKYYIVYGQYEERDATDCPELVGRIVKYKGVDYSSVYDFDYYIKHGKLAKKYKLDDYGALLHFIKTGMPKKLAGKEKCTDEEYEKYQKVSEVIIKDYKNGWLLHKGEWLHFTKDGDVDKLQEEAPTLTVIPGFFVTKMRTGNLNTREERIEAMIQCALDYIGTPYRICTSREPGVGCDCSGLVMQALYAAGFDPYPATPDHHARPENEYDSRTLFHQTPMLHVDFSQLKRGDLVYYRSERGNIIIHVAIYLGNGKVVEAWPPYVTDSYGVTAPPHPYVYGVTRPFP